jgi:hypothetical protein
MIALIDGDLLKYRCGFAAEDEPLSHALHNVKLVIDGITNAVDADEVQVHLSGKGNFRERIATIKPYKGNRDPDHKPKHGEDIVKYIMDNYPHVVADGEEADDTLGYTQTMLRKEDPYSSVIVSTDKDMFMIPGLNYNWVAEKYYDISKAEADRFFWTQMLTGDSTDNIPGVPKIGPVKAEKILDTKETWSEMYMAVLDQYLTAYENGYEAMVENARLLWIRRTPNEDVLDVFGQWEKIA